MSIREVIKKIVENLPEGLGQPLTHVPFGVRLGAAYRQSANAIRVAECVDPAEWDARLSRQLRAILKLAVDQVGFYRDFYGARGFSPDEVQSIQDWAHVPVVTKADLQGVPLAARCARVARGFSVNTGGTSGQPLEFQLDQQAFAREWAHMHHIWKARGYQPQHLKLTFRGKHFDRRQPLRYNAVHNEHVVNSNCSMQEVVEAVLALPRTKVIRWVHGYPSLVAEFAHALDVHAPSFAAIVRARLFGVLLGSEYPAPTYREAIERILSTNVVSWYGHSEMAVLARETALGVYQSLPTYGYAEAVPSDTGTTHRLVCTSLHNRVHPFIRYDTGDLIEPVAPLAGALAFRISEGRVGDFVVDRKGNRLALTAIIFGRHHNAFGTIQHVQVRQDAPGRIVFVVTPGQFPADAQALRRGFDFGDLDIDWDIEVVREPVRSGAGKIRLKIRSSDDSAET